MNTKKILVATLVGAVAFFLLGWIIWGMLLQGFMADHMTHYDGLIKEPPNMILMFVSMIFSALFYAIIFNRWANISTFKTGLQAGAIISVLLGLSYGLFDLSYFNLRDVTAVVVDVFANAVYGGLGGGIIAWVLGKVN